MFILSVSVKARSSQTVNMDKTQGNQLQAIREKLEETDPKELSSLHDHVKVCVDKRDNET